MTRPPRQPRTDSTPSQAAYVGAASAAEARITLGRVFRAESANYFVLLGTTLFLVVLGLLMVLSSSSVESYLGDSGFFGGFWRQALYALIGIPLMFVASRMPAFFWKKWAWVALIIGCVLQFVVVATPLGVGTGGNRNWIEIGGFNAQPSEVIKVALVIWLGLVLSVKEKLLADWKHALIPVIPIGGFAIMLVMAGGDLGTVTIMAGILVGALFFAGVRLKVLAIPVVAGALLGGLFAIASPNRMARILSFTEGCAAQNMSYSDACWQPLHGIWALASGGIFGVGLGNSKAKWSWLPAASNDYIFAVIGEELGLVGAVLVLALFVLLAIMFVRIMRTQTTMFGRVTTGAVGVWIIGQAFVNIGVVLGVLPVLGVPLPLISSGGTALLTSLLAIGIVLSLARQTPDRAPRSGRLSSTRVHSARVIPEPHTGVLR
jgi:cell division protein FtsW